MKDHSVHSIPFLVMYLHGLSIYLYIVQNNNSQVDGVDHNNNIYKNNNQCQPDKQHLTLKSIPTVEMKFPDKKVPSRNLTSRQVLPTPESPSSITFVVKEPFIRSNKFNFRAPCHNPFKSVHHHSFPPALLSQSVGES